MADNGSDLGTVEKLLALLVLEQLKEASDEERAAKMASAGLSVDDIAQLLGTSNKVVSQHLYSARQKKTKGKPARKKSNRKRPTGRS